MSILFPVPSKNSRVYSLIFDTTEYEEDASNVMVLAVVACSGFIFISATGSETTNTYSLVNELFSLSVTVSLILNSPLLGRICVNEPGAHWFV